MVVTILRLYLSSCQEELCIKMKENVWILKLNICYCFFLNKNLNLNSHMWKFTSRSDGYYLKHLASLSGLKWNASSNVYWGNKTENKCLIMTELTEVKGLHLPLVEFII